MRQFTIAAARLNMLMAIALLTVKGSDKCEHIPGHTLVSLLPK